MVEGPGNPGVDVPLGQRPKVGLCTTCHPLKPKITTSLGGPKSGDQQKVTAVDWAVTAWLINEYK